MDASNGNKLLEIKDLHVQFHTPEGTVHAVNGVSYDIYEGEAVAVVGADDTMLEGDCRRHNANLYPGEQTP